MQSGIIRGDKDDRLSEKRYLKWQWSDAAFVPPLGQLDYVPKDGGAMRIFEEGKFLGKQHLLTFPAQKTKLKLPKLERCAFCNRVSDVAGKNLALTSEHIIAEALGAGLELPAASCSDCQKVTAEFERSVISEIFDSVRRNLGLVGKEGILERQNFLVDLSSTETDWSFLHERDHPTILTLPRLYPPSTCSTRPTDGNGFFNLIVYNINCRKENLDKYNITKFATNIIDMARFCQMIAKIGHIAGTHFYRAVDFTPTVAAFIRTDLPPKTPSVSHFNNVGCLWRHHDSPSLNLHEIEVGEIAWQGRHLIIARVRLFATLNIPSFFVVVGELPA